MLPDYEVKANDAVDYSDINEVADEETEKVKDAMASLTMARQGIAKPCIDKVKKNQDLTRHGLTMPI